MYSKLHEWIKSKSLTADYAIIDVARNRHLEMLDEIYEGFNLIDLFHKIDADYIILKVSENYLPSVLSLYVECSQELKYIIPWIKLPFNDASLLNVTTKMKKCVDYVLVLQRSGCRNLKSLFSSVIIEPDKYNELGTWEKQLILNFNENNLSGIVITSDGYISDAKSLISTNKNYNRINLFEGE